MSQTMRRGQVGRNASGARSRGKARQGRGPLDRLMEALPIDEATLHRLFLGAILLVIAGLAVFVAVLAGAPAVAQAHLAAAASNAGFEVRHVEVRGVRRMNDLLVYERVLDERDRAMPQVDLAALRRKLLALPYVGDARVSRQLPDTLVVDIVERVPHAVLRRGTRYTLIDDTGRELERVGPERAARMLVLTGAGAGYEAGSIERLLRTVPSLRAQVREAEWVGKRRWNLAFRSGQVLALPEGERQAATALLAFAKLDKAHGLMGGRAAFFDMRVSDRIYLRVPGHAHELAEARAERAKAEAAAKAAAKAGAGKPAEERG